MTAKEGDLVAEFSDPLERRSRRMLPVSLTFILCQLLEHLADDLANTLQRLQIILTFLELFV